MCGCIWGLLKGVRWLEGKESVELCGVISESR